MIIKLLLPVAICIFALVIILALIISLGGKNKSRSRQRAKCPATKSPRYKSLAGFALEVDKDPTAIDINMRAVVIDLADGLENACKETGSEYCRDVLKDTIAALNRIAKASIADKRKPQIGSVSDLADLIEDKRAVISPSIKAVFTEIYDYCEIANAEDESEDIADILYDLERIIYPNGITESQAEAAAIRQAVKEAKIRAEKEVLKAKKTPPTREAVPNETRITLGGGYDSRLVLRLSIAPPLRMRLQRPRSRYEHKPLSFALRCGRRVLARVREECQPQEPCASPHAEKEEL